MARPRRHIPPLLATLGIAAALAGCGDREPAPPASPFPPRPVSIDVSSLDPCSGVSPAEQDRLGLETGRANTATVNGVASPACTWVGYSSEALNYSAQTIPLDAADAADEPGSRVIQLGGFGAVQGAPSTGNGPGLPTFCQIAVDVADGQTLRFQVNNGDPTPGDDAAAIDTVCSEARRFATDYLSTIRG